MHTRAWIALLRRLPPEQLDSLCVVTSVGIEISIQSILRTEDEYLILRGRLQGTTDTGRIFFIPYDQINYLGTTKEVKDTDLLAGFSGSGPGTAAAVPAKPQTAEALAKAEEAAEAPPADAAPENGKGPEKASPSSGRISIPDKQAILERLRARSQVGNPRPPLNP